MKILIHNVGYFLGHNGSLLEYVKYSHRYLYCDPEIKEANMGRFAQLLYEHDPDICGLIEVHDHPELLKLVEESHTCTMIAKYCETHPLARLEKTRPNCNAVLTREMVEVCPHYLGCGNKRLVLEVVFRDIHLYLVHLSLRKYIRKQQLLELRRLVSGKPKVIVCGDFNIFSGVDELEPLLFDGDLRLVSKPHHQTFPAVNPKKMLDIFLCSEGLRVTSLQVLDIVLSDHLPVLLEVTEG